MRDLYVRKETRDLESIITTKKRENHQIRASSWTRPAQVLHPPWQKAARAVHRDSAPYHAWRWPSTPRRGAPDWPPPPWIRRGPALAQICHGKRAAEGTGGRARHRAVGEVDAAVRARHRAAGEVDAVEVYIGHAVQVDAAGSALEERATVAQCWRRTRAGPAMAWLAGCASELRRAAVCRASLRRQRRECMCAGQLGRQVKSPLCRVPPTWHSAKVFLNFF